MKKTFNKIINWWIAYYKFSTRTSTIIIFLILISIFFYFKINYENKKICKEKREQFMRWSHNGIVKNKYEDMEQHAYNILVFERYQRLNLDSILMGSDPVYDNINIGDSLAKEMNSDTLWIYKERGIKFYVFENCEN